MYCRIQVLNNLLTSCYFLIDSSRSSAAIFLFIYPFQFYVIFVLGLKKKHNTHVRMYSIYYKLKKLLLYIMLTIHRATFVVRYNVFRDEINDFLVVSC